MEGTIITVLDFGPFRLPQSQLIARSKVEAYTVSLYTTEKNQLKIQIGHIEFISQPFRFTGSNIATVAIRWRSDPNPYIDVQINGLKLHDHTTESLITFQTKVKEVNNIPSIIHHEATTVCENWIQWRVHRYGFQKMHPKQNRIVKPIEIQRQELKNCIDLLQDLVEKFDGNESRFLIISLPILRSLLFWPDGKSTSYNPLLIRIAGYYSLPLPVYSMRYEEQQTREGLQFHSLGHYARIIQQFENEKLMDVQEWLSSVAMRINLNELKTFTWKDVLFNSANTLSSTHFDDDLPIEINQLLECFNGDLSLLFTYIQSLVNVTITLGDFVLSHNIESEVR